MIQIEDAGTCMLCAVPWVGCLCATIVDDLAVRMRRATECGDFETAAEIAAAIELRGAGRA